MLGEQIKDVKGKVGLRIRNLTIHTPSQIIAGPINLDLVPGRPLTLLGETGAGKSLIAQAILGALPDGLSATGEIFLDDERLDDLNLSARRALWGRSLVLLPQEPWTALNPTMRAAAQIAETHRFVGGYDASKAASLSESDLRTLDLDHAARLYPHQLSGGMAQRAAFATALAGGANAVIADEPTKGLEATLRTRIAEQLLSVSQSNGLLLTITHDPALARKLGGDVALVQAGKIVEQGPADLLLSTPSSTYGKVLLAAEPSAWPQRSESQSKECLVSCKKLAVSRGNRVLLRDIDLDIHAGERIAVIGPSGSGKSSLLDVLAGLLRPSAGRLMRSKELVGTGIQKLYQDPPAAFASTLPLKVALQDVERLHNLPSDRIPSLLARLGVDLDITERTPDAVSGGELQRIALARVLAIRPAVLLADEPTSRLDLLTQQRLMDLLGETADETGAAVVLVTHDPDIAQRWADRTISLGG